MTQCQEFRSDLLSPITGYFQRLLSTLIQGSTVIERRGIASAVFNCMLDPEKHLILLNEPFEILPVLLYPLAGPEEYEVAIINLL